MRPAGEHQQADAEEGSDEPKRQLRGYNGHGTEKDR
jgi:hypothetical protein